MFHFSCQLKVIMPKTSQTNRITAMTALVKPQALCDALPLTEAMQARIASFRASTSRILQGLDDRLLVVVGPCSIHDELAAIEYAHRLQAVATSLSADLHIVMRTYFEKPRTLLGWKGLISDPELSGNCNMNLGLQKARSLLLQITELGLPVATEFLDAFIPQYLADCITWSAIGARTVESPVHRELASGLNMPVGFKNTTDGNITIAIEAIQAARHPHHYLSLAPEGCVSIIETCGNSDGHLVLRGSRTASNYHQVASAINALEQAQLPTGLLLDCSHGNSMKNHEQQYQVALHVSEEIAAGNTHIRGVMLESNLVAGSQFVSPGTVLVYGQSITDACMSWEATELLLKSLSHSVKMRRQKP